MTGRAISCGLLIALTVVLCCGAEPFAVQECPGYNSWPMVQAIGNRLVCAYSRGWNHDILEEARGVYARFSDDFGRTWSKEVCVVNSKDHSECAIGKGLDGTGAMLLWVRAFGKKDKHHELYRTHDGAHFEKVVVPNLAPTPVQITDVFAVPGKGLMALWFAGAFTGDGKSWGTLVSADNGLTWKQKTIELAAGNVDWATEPSAVYLGNGRILAIARTEVNSPSARQFQLTSTDYGDTWNRKQTNIGDICYSTPSLVYTSDTDNVCNYYYERGKGLIKRRVCTASSVFGSPNTWPEPQVVGHGGTIVPDAGNVNVTTIGNRRFIAYYSGKAPNTAIYLMEDESSVEPGQVWMPFNPTAEIKEGSAMDFSCMCGQVVPHGSHGRLIVAGDNFEFEGRKGTPQRFYGANLCFSACFPKTAQDAEKLVRRLAAVGYNAVRIHHHDRDLVRGSQDGTRINPDQLDRLERLFAVLKKAGFLVSTDLYVSREIPWREIGVGREGTVPPDEFKNLVRTNALARANLKRFAKAWLGHVNPYTGLSWAEDPALAWISLVNENAVKGADELEREREFASDIKCFLRDELKCRALISDLNGGDIGLGALYPRYREYDYVDEHFYYAHPRFSGTGWTMPSSYESVSPARHWAVGAFGVGARRLIDRPFVASEFHFCPPCAFRGASGLFIGAQAALQGWGGVWRFAWSHCDWKSVSPTCREINYFDVSNDPITLASERFAVALYLRGDLKPLGKTAVAVVCSDELRELDKQICDNRWQRAIWSAKLGVAVDEAPPGAIVLGGGEVFSASAEDVLRKAGLPAGQVRFDNEKGMFAIDTPCSKAVLAGAGTVNLNGFSVTINDAPATVFAVSLDGKPLGASSRILVAHLTDVRNTGDRIPSDGMLDGFGTLPLLMRCGRAEISLARQSSGTVFALSADGSRTRRIAATHEGGVLHFTADISAEGRGPEWLSEISM